MLKAATSRLLKARFWAYNPVLLANNRMHKQQNNKIFHLNTLKGKSKLSHPVLHISITPYLDYFENLETFQIQQEGTFLKSKPFHVLPLKCAAQNVKSIPQITTDRIESVAKIEQRKMDVEKIVEIIIEAEVSNTKLLKEAYVKTMPKNSTSVHQVDQIGQSYMNSNKAKDNNGKIALKDAYIKTMAQNSTDIKTLVNKTTDSERKAKVFNASLLKDANVKIMALNSYRTEPSVKIKQNNMNSEITVDSKSLAEIFNAGLLKETCIKCIPQNSSDTKDFVSKIGQNNMDANNTADSETKAALFNASLLKDDDAVKNYNKKGPIFHTKHRNSDSKKTENSNNLTDVFNATHKDTYVKTPPDLELEPIADSRHGNIDCNKIVDNKINTNFTIGEAYVKNMPQNRKDPACNINQVNIDGNITADSERKAKVFNANLLKDAYVKMMALNSHRIEPNVKIKHHNMDSKKTVDSKTLAEIFNARLQEETFAKFMSQNPSNTKDLVSLLDQDNTGVNNIADGVTKAA